MRKRLSHAASATALPTVLAANDVCLHSVVVECRSSSSEHSIPILACAGSRNTVGDNAADAAFKHTAILVIILMTMAVTGAPLEL